MLTTLLMSLAALLPAAAQDRSDPAPPPQAASWALRTVEGQPTLRGATAAEPGDRIILMCNDERRLVAMLFRLHDDPEALAQRMASGSWLIDGAALPAQDPGPILPAGPHVISFGFVDAELFHRLLAARAAGFAWSDASGSRIDGYQIEIASGHALLAAFARDCNAETYR